MQNRSSQRADLRRSDPLHFHALGSAFPARQDFNSGGRHVQTFREEAAERLIGAIVHRRSGHANLQCALKFATDGVAAGAWLHAHLKNHAAAARGYANHFFGRSPKIAEPMRTCVAPSSIATSKSWLIPMESSGNLRPNCCSRSSRRRRKRRK